MDKGVTAVFFPLMLSLVSVAGVTVVSVTVVVAVVLNVVTNLSISFLFGSSGRHHYIWVVLIAGTVIV